MADILTRTPNPPPSPAPAPPDLAHLRAQPPSTSQSRSTTPSDNEGNPSLLPGDTQADAPIFRELLDFGQEIAQLPSLMLRGESTSTEGMEGMGKTGVMEMVKAADMMTTMGIGGDGGGGDEDDEDDEARPQMALASSPFPSFLFSRIPHRRKLVRHQNPTEVLKGNTS
ncbi:hypothetical protein FRC09_003963 [Ceratobasidium sp. 395]|nr:hypothetical protein FRC09_003963 [Ceratobasidium sp. 395]